MCLPKIRKTCFYHRLTCGVVAINHAADIFTLRSKLTSSLLHSLRLRTDSVCLFCDISEVTIKRLRQRDSELNSVWGTICTPHQFLSTDGKRHATNCASIEGMLVHRLWMLLFGDVGGCTRRVGSTCGQGGFRGTNRQKGGDITQYEAVS